MCFETLLNNYLRNSDHIQKHILKPIIISNNNCVQKQIFEIWV